MCDSTAAGCPNAGNTKATFTISLDDGPISLLMSDGDTTSTHSFLPTFDDFAITSLNILTDNNNDFSSAQYDPRIYLYEIVSPDYKRMWVHSQKKQFIEARPWLLSILSMGILKPSYIRGTLIHIPANCPLYSANNVKQNTLIKDKLWSKVYTQDTHLIAQKANGTYYEFFITSKGDYLQNTIPFINNNIYIMICLIVSSVIALYSVIAVFLILLRLKWKLERWLDNYLEKKRKFAKAKKEIQFKNDDSKRKIVTTKVKKRVFKMLKINLYTTNIKKKTIEFTEEDENEIIEKQRMQKRIALSFFQTPALYLEHLRRQRTNSFREFLNNIYQSAPHFPKWKLNNAASWKTISVRIDKLEPMYLEFCTKGGYKPKDIEEEQQVLMEYNLKLDYRIDNSTDAYTNIRWKSPLEKMDEATASKIAEKSAEDAEETIIQKFLLSECSKSAFDQDYILGKQFYLFNLL
jgi:hypothetical protein